MKKFCQKILKNKITTFFLVFSLIFCSLTLLFPAGALHSSTKIEATSEYIADIAENHSKNGKYAAMMVEPKDGSTQKIRDSYDEFLALYGIFREGLATYSEAVNADKTHNVSIKELNNGVNYSFFHIDRGYGAEPYKGHYKTMTYPLEVMFNNKHPYDPKGSFVYVSQSVADKLLDSQGKEHNEANYKSLIHYFITIEIDGKKVKYYIDNIYYEINYFYDALYEVMGDFIVGGAYYPPGVFKKQGIFFLRNYSYQNEYYINYATSIYPSTDFDYRLLERNLDKDFVVDYSRINLFVNNQFNYVCYLILSVCILLLVLSILLLIFGDFTVTLKNHLLIALALFGPYLIFFLAHLIFKNVMLFSSFSTMCCLWCCLVYIILYIFVCVIKKRKVCQK